MTVQAPTGRNIIANGIAIRFSSFLFQALKGRNYCCQSWIAPSKDNEGNTRHIIEKITAPVNEAFPVFHLQLLDE